jgi:hypothetical protein
LEAVVKPCPLENPQMCFQCSIIVLYFHEKTLGFPMRKVRLDKTWEILSMFCFGNVFFNLTIVGGLPCMQYVQSFTPNITITQSCM